MLKDREIEFTPILSIGDTVKVRFKLHSDPYTVGWGWAIDDLYVQMDKPVVSGVEDISIKKISIYPNPSTGIFNIQFNGELVPTGQKSLVRSTDGKILTNVGENWTPVQNEEAFNFFGEYVLAGNMEMHTAGSLKGGQMVWALAKVKDSFELFGGDKVDSYLLFSNPHQYG